MSSREREEAVTKAGRLRGRREGEVVAFRAVPYAAPPVGSLRFAPPEPARPWDGVCDATGDGPIAPQPPSRAAVVMGDIVVPQGEDCLSLTIWTQEPSAGRRPVLVWFHGGGFASGAGSLDWYDGARLAAMGDLVVVGVNYRLGALGWLLQPEVAPGNLGLLDQRAALGWVHANIDAFGGDPEAITVAGQSGGAHNIVSLLTIESTRGQFRRAILQSPPLGIGLHTRAEAARTADAFAAALGLPPDQARSRAAFRALPLDRIIGAQAAVARDLSRVPDGDLRPAFMPAEAAPYAMPGPDLSAAAVRAAAARDVRVLIGWTREEANLFYGPDLRALDEKLLEAKAERLVGAAWESRRALAMARRPDASPAQLFLDVVGDQTLRLPSLDFAQRLAAEGGTAFVYQFDWASPAPGLGACHCIELPFVFASHAAFARAPMIAGADAAQVAALTATMMRCWIAFATGGDPNHAALPAWRAYDDAHRTVMHLDRQPRAARA